MNWIVEDPTPVLVAAVLVEAVLTIALVRTGRAALLFAIVGVGVLAAALLALEFFVVTDKERIEETLSGAARALEANDAAAVMAFIDPNMPMRNRVKQEMGLVKIEKATFSRLDVTVNRHTSPPTAEADFIGYVNGHDRKGELPYENFMHRFVVQFRLVGDRWLMTGYEMPERGRGE